MLVKTKRSDFAQHPNMTQVKLISNPAKYFDLLSSNKVNVTDANFINNEIIEVHYENVDEFVEANGKTNIVVAAFTTAHARLKLYGVLEQFGRRVLYFDTDSFIYVSKEGNWEPPIGSCLGTVCKSRTVCKSIRASKRTRRDHKKRRTSKYGKSV